MYSDDETLAHFGVKGMKWGRRKQRPHGGGQGRMSARQKRARDMSNMSDTELQRYLNRRRMENEYHKMNRTGGEKFRSWAVGIGKQAAERAAKRAANQLVDRGLDAGASALRAYGPSALEGAKSLGSRAKGALKRTPGKELVRYDPGVGGGIGPRRKSRGEQLRESLGGLGSKARSAASRAQGGLGGLGSKARSAMRRSKQSTPGKELVLHNPTARGQAAFEALKRKQRRENSGFKQGRPGTTMRRKRVSRQRG